jgi:hypothetical protein
MTMPGGYHNQARMTISSAGTGNFALLAAVPPFNTFANAGVVDQEIVPYSALDGTSNSEKGWGLYVATGSSTGGPSLSRNPFISTNGNNPINASAATQVFIDLSAADAIHLSRYAHASCGGL